MKIYRKYLVIGVIILFVGACVIPGISGFERNNDEDVLQYYDIVDELLHRDGIKDFYTGSTGLAQQSYLDPPNILWNKTFGGDDDDVGYKIRKTTDDGFIILGNTDNDFWLLKIDENGDEVWSNSYGNPQLDEFAMDVQQTSDGGYIIVGYFFFFQEHDQGILLVRTSSDGVELWNTTFGTESEPASASSVYQTADGGFLIFGNDWINDDSLYLIKTDDTGDLLWEKNVVGCGDWFYTFCSAETDDGGYVITGFVGMGYDIDMFVMKIDSDHDKEWCTTMGGELFDSGFSVIQTDDGKYVVAGVADSIDDYIHGDVWLVQLDDQGDVVWSNIIDADVPEIPYSVQVTNSGFVVVGTSMSSTIGAYDLLVYITDEIGDVIERWTIGGNSYDEGYYVYVTFKGDYIITGYTNSFGTKGSADLWFLKIEGLEANLPPSAPTINGPKSGRIGIAYPYNFNSTDPNGDKVSYFIRWGDGTITDWTVLQASGYPGYTESRSWGTRGEYTIAARAKDEHDAYSGWTELDVDMPRNKAVYHPLFIKLFERFPILERLLSLIRVC